MSEPRLKLVRSKEQGWAINSRGRRVDLAGWDVLLGARRIGWVHQYLSSGGSKPWTAEGDGLYMMGLSRKEAVALVLAHVERATPTGGPRA